MTLDFLLPHGQHNFNFFTQEKRKKIAYITKLLKKEVNKILEYDKNNNRY